MIDSDARSAGDARRSREPDATGERLIHTAVEGRGEGGGEGAEGEGGGRRARAFDGAQREIHLIH